MDLLTSMTYGASVGALNRAETMAACTYSRCLRASVSVPGVKHMNQASLALEQSGAGSAGECNGASGRSMNHSHGLHRDTERFAAARAHTHSTRFTLAVPGVDTTVVGAGATSIKPMVEPAHAHARLVL